MSLRIKILTLGMVSTNAYLIGDDETKKAILIDPVDQADILFDSAKKEGWAIELILATHAHFDHVLASKKIKELTQAPFWIHQDAAKTLALLPQRGVHYTGTPFPEAAEPDQFLTTESEKIDVGNIHLETLYTPGHAHGHIAFYMPSHKIVFSGDALFAGSIGRTDLEGGSLDLLLNSIQTKLLTLEDDVIVLSGHGDQTTIGEERIHNPYLQELR